MAIIKSTNRAAWDAAAKSTTESTVGYLTTEREVVYNGVNVVTKAPKRGDIIFLDDEGNICIASRKTVDIGFKDTHTCFAVVVEVWGDTVLITHKDSLGSQKWSEVATFAITFSDAQKSALWGDTTAKSLSVNLMGVAAGTWSYTPASGLSTDDAKVADYIEKLNTWLSANTTVLKAANDIKVSDWSAYVHTDGTATLQLNKYVDYESSCAITNTTVTKNIGSEIADITQSTMQNMYGDLQTYRGMCRPRLQQYCENSISSYCNPATAVATALTYPVSRAYYEGELGNLMRAKYGDNYEKYLDYEMCRIPTFKGAMRFRDGAYYTSRLSPVTYKHTDGTYKPKYTAANKCGTLAVQFDGADVDGIGAGDWYLPSMYELMLLMNRITYGLGTYNGVNYNAVDSYDDLNDGLRRIGGALISCASNRWSSVRCSSNSAWLFSYTGLSGSNYFYGRFAVGAFAALKLVKN